MSAPIRTPEAWAALDALGHEEKLEDLSGRLRLPFIAEYELSMFRRLRWSELDALRRGLEAGSASADDHVLRGRLLRLLGDNVGAARELRLALDLDPSLACAHAYLAELDLRAPEAEAGLTRALELDGKLARAWLYRGACRLLSGNLSGAEFDLRRRRELAGDSALGLILAGLVQERLGRRRAAAGLYRRAAELDPVCAAACLLWSRAEPNAAASAKAAEQALDADPTYALITLQRGRRGGDWKKYLAWMRGFAFREPELAGWYYRVEDFHYSPYQFQEYEDSQTLHRARPGRAWAAGLVARGTLRCPPDPARAKQGLECLDKAISWSPKSGWLHAWRALGWIKDGKPQRALEDFNECVRLQPYYHRAYAWRGALLRKLGRTKEALADLDRALAVDEQYPFAAHERSLARRDAGDIPGAVSDMDRAFQLDFRYAWVFTVGREPTAAELEAAVAGLDAAVERYPSLASLRIWRGELKLQRRDFSAAFLDFEDAAHLDPHQANAQAFHGRGLIDAGRGAEAVKKLRRAVELAPEMWIFRGWLAEALARSGRPQEALALLSSILKAKPKTWWVYHIRTAVYLQLGRPKQALRDIEEAVDYEGRHADGWYLAAQAKLALGDLEGASEAVEKTLIISPNLGRAYILRAQIRQKLGRYDGVLEDYRTVYEKFPYLFNEEERGRVKALLSA